MSRIIRQSTKFRRDIKRLKRQGKDVTKLQTLVKLLVAQKPLVEQYSDHMLTGIWKGFRECHIQPNWLLIYRIEKNELQLVRTGSHAELFG